MSTMIFEVYDALKEAGASEEKASAAAKAIADYEGRFNNIDADLKVIKAELKLVKWVSGIVLAGIISLIIKTFLT